MHANKCHKFIYHIMNKGWMDKKKVIVAIFVSLTMILTAFAVFGVGPMGQLAQSSNGLNLNGHAASSQSSPSSTSWQMPTTTMHEPNYTGGTFTMGINCNVNTLNYFPANTYCDVYVIDEIYDGMYSKLPTGQVIPWLATNYSVSHVTSNNQTFDILTNSTQNYSYVYTVNLRPYVQWTDWSAANASQTYTFSNTTQFYCGGVLTSHTYKSFNSTTMKKYYLQSADVVLSWRLQGDFGLWPSVVNLIPNGNLSVKIFVSKQTMLFNSNVLTNDILPYHIWVHHDFTSLGGLFNCTPGISSGNGYYGWNLGWNSATGVAPGLVGTGPFMVTNNYGLPSGKVIPSNCESLYVNPHYFVQYANASSGLRQYTPKFYEIYMPFYSSESALVAAYQKGQIDTTSLSVPASFEPQITSAPGSNIYHKPSSAYGLFNLNTAVAPLNITAFRQALNYATPYSYIENTVAGGLGISSSSPINPTNLLFYNTSALNYNFNMKKADSLLDSIPGMANVSGTLTYLGTPVCINIQTTVGSVAPTNIETIDQTQLYWKELGIKSSLHEEAFTSLISSVDSTISSFNQSSYSRTTNNNYQAAVYALSTGVGDIALSCQDTLNPAFGVPLDSYVGPFSNMTVNGKDMSGLQIQSLFDNLTTKMVSTNSFSTASKIAKRLQDLMVREAFMINTGYGIDLVPELNNFKNYSQTNTEAMYLYWYWQFFGISLNHPPKVHYNYSLTVSAKLNNQATQYQGDRGSITFTVTNKTSTGAFVPVPKANISIGISALYGGVLNISSNSNVTNSKGQYTWNYTIFSKLGELFDASGVGNNLVYFYYEEANITAIATAYHAKQTGPGNATATLWVINPSLDISCSVSSSVLAAGKSGQLVFQVTENGTGVSGATVTLSPVDLANITYSSSELTLTTNSTGYAVFNFTVNSNVTGFYNDTVNVCAKTSNATLGNATTTATIPLEKAPPSSSSNMLLYAEIGGVVAAVVVVVGVGLYVVRRPKAPSPPSGEQ